MSASPPPRRSDCPISFALEIFGDRWTLLVLRDLMLKGKRHYSEFLASEEGIATNILSDRLRRLERRGLITKTADTVDRRQVVYGPTETGMGLIPMLIEMTAWGARNDPRTAADSAFVKAFERDRDGLIDSFVRAARERSAS